MTLICISLMTSDTEQLFTRLLASVCLLLYFYPFACWIFHFFIDQYELLNTLYINSLLVTLYKYILPVFSSLSPSLRSHLVNKSPVLTSQNKDFLLFFLFRVCVSQPGGVSIKDCLSGSSREGMLNGELLTKMLKELKRYLEHNTAQRSTASKVRKHPSASRNKKEELGRRRELT